MQSYLAAYLFQLNRISLPKLGSFSVTNSPAVSDFSGKIINAPVTSIQFTSSISEESVDDFVQYIAKKKGISQQLANEQYQQWCNDVQQQLAQGSKVQLAGIGSLREQAGDINFEQLVLTPVFFPQVPAERVVHPETEHTMLVGDKETTNVEMTEYYAASPQKKNRWWLWALLLTLLGMATIIFKWTNDGTSLPATGNACTFETITPGSLYKVIE